MSIATTIGCGVALVLCAGSAWIRWRWHGRAIKNPGAPPRGLFVCAARSASPAPNGRLRRVPVSTRRWKGMAYYKARGFLQIVKPGGSIMRTLGKIAAMLGVIGAIVAGSATPAAAYYYHHHSGYQHHHHYGYHSHYHHHYYHHY